MRRGFLMAAMASVLLTAGAASAHRFERGDIVVDHPASRPTPGGSKVGVGYLVISNNGRSEDRLVGGSSEVSDRLELHTSTITDGIARMRPVEGGIAIAPGSTLDLESGATHIMLVGLKRPLVAGSTFRGELRFEKAGSVEIEFKVEPHGTAPASSHGGHSK